MDRTEWLHEKRRQAEERMDTLFAPIYDENWGKAIEPMHRSFLGRLVELISPGDQVLDAACGTGKYWSVLLEAGLRITGIDQSSGMLRVAHEKFPMVSLSKMGLQEMTFTAPFNAVLCIDAMENIFPEDWPRVLENFHRAVLPGGYVYLTVELEGEQALGEAYARAVEQGFPVVWGEVAYQPGYHYYPRLEQVREWLVQAHFRLLDEDGEGEYQHFLAKRERE